MHKQQLAQRDADYAAYLERAGCHTLREAAILSGLSPDSLRVHIPALAGEKLGCFTQSIRSSDYFVFYQVGGRWNWQRINDSDMAVDGSSRSFRCYELCVADAREHGWEGRPVSLFFEKGCVSRRRKARNR